MGFFGDNQTANFVELPVSEIKKRIRNILLSLINGIGNNETVDLFKDAYIRKNLERYKI